MCATYCVDCGAVDHLDFTWEDVQPGLCLHCFELLESMEPVVGAGTLAPPTDDLNWDSNIPF